MGKATGITLYDATGVEFSYSFETNGWKCSDPSTLLWLKSLFPSGAFANATDMLEKVAVYGISTTKPEPAATDPDVDTITTDALPADPTDVE